MSPNEGLGASAAAEGPGDGVATGVGLLTGEAGRAQILHVWPGFYEGAIYGLAVDLGSTTIAGHLCDLATGEVLASTGLMNPQIRFGEDLMSRISYAMMNPGGAAEMTSSRR